MNTVFERSKSNLAVSSTIITTLLLSVVRCSQYSCGQEELVRCAQPLQVFTDAGLTFVASKKDLDIICPDLRDGLRCVQSYTNRCMTLAQKTHFSKLFHGTNSMVKELCQNGSYQAEYLKYAPCMRKVVEQNELCFKRYQETMNNVAKQQNSEHQFQRRSVLAEDTTKEEINSVNEINEEEDGLRNVCCSFQEYIECSTHTMRRACGEDAAQFSKGFLDRMSSSMIKLHCSEYVVHERNCGYSSSSQVNSSLLLLLFILIVHIVYVLR